MVASRDARLVIKLLVFSSLFFAISVARSNGKRKRMGYEFVNMSRVPDCYSMPKKQQVCPTTLINYQVVDYDSGLEIVETALTSVQLTVDSLNFFPGANKTCRKSLREYACSNMFAICHKDPTHGLTVKYDFNRTGKACAAVKANCPQAVQRNTIYNCTNIMRDPREFQTCITLPKVAGDLCRSKTNGYKYSLPSVKVYPQVANNLKQSVSYIEVLFKNKKKMLKKYLNIVCQLNPGPVCSDDGILRMYGLSRQKCARTMRKILPGLTYFQNMCNIFPDGKTAKRVPFPSRGSAGK